MVARRRTCTHLDDLRAIMTHAAGQYSIYHNITSRQTYWPNITHTNICLPRHSQITKAQCHSASGTHTYIIRDALQLMNFHQLHKSSYRTVLYSFANRRARDRFSTSRSADQKCPLWSRSLHPRSCLSACRASTVAGPPVAAATHMSAATLQPSLGDLRSLCEYRSVPQHRQLCGSTPRPAAARLGHCHQLDARDVALRRPRDRLHALVVRPRPTSQPVPRAGVRAPIHFVSADVAVVAALLWRVPVRLQLYLASLHKECDSDTKTLRKPDALALASASDRLAGEANH